MRNLQLIGALLGLLSLAMAASSTDWNGQCENCLANGYYFCTTTYYGTWTEYCNSASSTTYECNNAQWTCRDWYESANMTTVKPDTTTGDLHIGTMPKGTGRVFKIMNNAEKSLNVSVTFEEEDGIYNNTLYMYTYGMDPMPRVATHEVYNNTEGHFVVIPEDIFGENRTFNVYVSNAGERDIDIQITYSFGMKLLLSLAAALATFAAYF